MSKSSFTTRGAPRPPSGESGTTIVEAMIAIAVLAVGAFSALTTLTSSSALDEDLGERSLALRAATTQMEAIAAFDYAGDIDVLVNAYSQDQKRRYFAVDGLASGGDQDGGAVTFDTTDPQRIVATVTVTWATRGGQPRSLALSRTMTEVVE